MWEHGRNIYHLTWFFPHFSQDWLCRWISSSLLLVKNYYSYESYNSPVLFLIALLAYWTRNTSRKTNGNSWWNCRVVTLHPVKAGNTTHVRHLSMTLFGVFIKTSCLWFGGFTLYLVLATVLSLPLKSFKTSLEGVFREFQTQLKSSLYRLTD